MNRWLKRGLLGFSAVLVLAVLCVVGGLIWLRSGLPELDGEIKNLKGLSAPTSISRDESGRLWIKANSQNDASYALGFAHAQDRLWQMEIMRRLGAGRLSEILGDGTLGFDKLMRTLGFARLAEENLRRLSPEARALVEAYAAGVNAYLETRSGPLPPEFVLLSHTPEPWKSSDSLVWGRLMSLQLAGNWFSEILRARMVKAGIDPQDLPLLWHQPGEKTLALTLPQLAALESLNGTSLAALRKAIHPEVEPRLASNWWGLSAALTQSGKPLLAGDPHLGFQSPNLWHLARIEAPGYLRVGAFVPGVPFLVIGHNGEVAWTFTTTHSDTQDLFVEKLVDGNEAQYLTPNGPRSFASRVETIYVDDQPVEHIVRTSRHGPIVSDGFGKAGLAAGSGTVLALASPVLAKDDGTAEALFQLGSSASVQEAFTALRNFHSPQQNIALADTLGNLGYVSAGRVPIRNSGNGFLPAPGWDGSHDWLGYARFEDLPQEFNPAGSAIVNANERVIGQDPTLFLGQEFDAPYRAQRITQRLASALSSGKVSQEEMADIQRDAHSLAAQELAPVLLNSLDESALSELGKQAVSLLSNWTGHMGAEQSEPLIYTAWTQELHRRIFSDELKGLFGDYRRLRVPTLLELLRQNHRFCDNQTSDTLETCGQLMLASLESSLNALKKTYGSKMTDWRWGAAHKATFAHRVWRHIPLVEQLTTVKAAKHGGDYTVDRGSFHAKGRTQFPNTHGPGFRAVYDLSDLDRSTFTAALGASGHPLSRYATRWHDDWMVNRQHEMPPAPDMEQHRLTLHP